MSYDDIETIDRERAQAERDAERFYASAEGLAKELDSRTAEMQELLAERGATIQDLLEALKGVLRIADRKHDAFDAARAAIERAEGKP